MTTPKLSQAACDKQKRDRSFDSTHPDPDPHTHPDLVRILYTHPDPASTLEPPYTPIVTVLGEQISECVLYESGANLVLLRLIICYVSRSITEITTITLRHGLMGILCLSIYIRLCVELGYPGVYISLAL